MHLRTKIKKGKLSGIRKHNQKVLVFYLEKKHQVINPSLSKPIIDRDVCNRTLPNIIACEKI